jgi:hypothetical protein
MVLREFTASGRWPGHPVVGWAVGQPLRLGGSPVGQPSTKVGMPRHNLVREVRARARGKKRTPVPSLDPRSSSARFWSNR